jgi:prolyl-tRNA editing enzyme YbaK/EbsC (Cys-tRNA(Pro) deacylase)
MLLPRGKYKTLLLKIDKGAVSIFIGDAAISLGAFAKTVGVVAISVKFFL